MNKFKVWGEWEYSQHFKVPLHKSFINYKGKNNLKVWKCDRYHLYQMIKVKIISNKTKWNCVPLERIKYHFCDVPVRDVYNLNWIVRKHRTNPNWWTFYSMKQLSYNLQKYQDHQRQDKPGTVYNGKTYDNYMRHVILN